MGEGQLLDVRWRRHGGEIRHDDGPALLGDPLVDRPREIRHVMVHGVREEAGVGQFRPVVQVEDPVALEGGHPEEHVAAAEEDAQLVLEGLEARSRGDGLAVDEVALQGGQHLLARHVHGADHGEPRDHEPIGGQEIGQARRVEESGPETLERVRRERGHLAAHAHVGEVRQELELEVPLQTAVWHAEHERKIERQLEPVHALENERPRLELVHGHYGALVHVDAPIEPPVRPKEVALEGGGGVDVQHSERHERGDVDEVPTGRREHRRHHRVDQRPVAGDDAEVFDRAEEFGRLIEPLADLPPHRPIHGFVAPGEVLPEIGQGLQAQLRGEGEVRAGLGESGPDVC